MKRPASKTYQLGDLLDARAKIQLLNLICLKILRQNFPEASGGGNRSGSEVLFSALHDLIGSNFSLWRYAFLIYNSESDENKIKALDNMLHGLIEDNTFIFAHEVAAQSWLGPYYRENSMSRVESARATMQRYFVSNGLRLPSLEESSHPISKEIFPDSEFDQTEDHFINSFNFLAKLFNDQIDILKMMEAFVQERRSHGFVWPKVRPLVKISQLHKPVQA